MNQINLNLRKNIEFKSTPVVNNNLGQTNLQDFQNQNINQIQANTSQTEQLPEVQIPDIYYTPEGAYNKKTFKEGLKEADMMGLVYPWVAHPVLMLGTCAGLAYGVDKFSSACGGEYEKSLLGKVARFGDKIEESNFVQSKNFQSILNAGKSATKKINNFFKNSDVINAIKNNPSMPQCSMVKDEMLNMEQRVTHNFSLVADKLQLNSDLSIKITDIGLNNSEKEMIKKYFNVTDIAKVSQKDAVNYVLLKRLDLPESEITRIVNLGDDATKVTKEQILKALNLTADEITEIRKEPHLYIDKIKQAVTNVKGKVKVGAGEYSFLGPFQPFKRTIGCDEIFNRFHSMSDGAKTKTGKVMSRFLQKLHRGFTFGGGKLGVLLFVSPLLVETMLDVKKAEKDQKIGTAAHGLIEAVSWVFTFPLALNIMHHLAGAQYAGMSKDAIEEVRNIKKKFNNTKFDSYSAYKAELKKQKEIVKNLEKVEGQNLLTKICRKVGKFVTIDLERFKSYRNGTFGGNLVRKIPGFFKNITGVPMRLGIWGVLSMGVLGTAITKCTKALFGNYYDRFKEEEFETNKKKQKEFLHNDLQERLYNAQARKVQAQMNVQTPQTVQAIINPESITSKTPEEIVPEQKTQIETQNTKVNTQTEVKNEIKNDKNNTIQETKPITNDNKQVVENKYIPNPNPNPNLFKEPQKTKRDNYTYIPSSENVIKNETKKEDINKYIPSQLAGNFSKTFDNSGLESALRRADRAEDRAIKTLAGNFDAI